MSNLDQLRPPPCKKRKLRLNSSFFDGINPEQPILHPPPPMPKLKHLLQEHLDPHLLHNLSNQPASSASSKSPSSQDQMDSRLLHEPSIHEAGVTASTPESVGGYFPEFFPDVAVQNHPSPILSDKQRAAKLLSTQPAPSKPSPYQSASSKPPSIYSKQLCNTTVPKCYDAQETVAQSALEHLLLYPGVLRILCFCILEHLEYWRTEITS